VIDSGRAGKAARDAYFASMDARTLRGLGREAV
jgi:hypothetical protein